MQVVYPDAPPSPVRPNFPINLTQLYINGEWRDSSNGKTFAAINPTTEEEVAQLAEGTVEDVEVAVQAAGEAFETGAWSQLSGHERGEILWRVGDLFRKYGEEFAFLQAKEMGRLFRDSMTVDIPHLANMFHYYAGWASKIEGAVKTTKGLHTYLYVARTVGDRCCDHAVQLSANFVDQQVCTCTRGGQHDHPQACFRHSVVSVESGSNYGRSRCTARSLQCGYGSGWHSRQCLIDSSWN